LGSSFINLTTSQDGLPHTITEPTNLVLSLADCFAEEWGFIKTHTNIVNSIEEFTSHGDKVGEQEGEELWKDSLSVHMSASHPPIFDPTVTKPLKENYHTLSDLRSISKSISMNHI
jgi:hypothetical protein